MADTTNSSADPWGLPENDSISIPDPDLIDDEVESTPTGSVEPVEESLEIPEPATADFGFEIAGEEPGESSAPHELPGEPTPPPKPESRGPLSQVLAASGLFGGYTVPPATESTEPEETGEAGQVPEPIEESFNTVTLETVAEDDSTEPPGLTEPTSGAPLGVGATDADLPPEPPPWMVTEPIPTGQDAATEELHDAAVDEVATLGIEAAVDEAAAAFAEISISAEADVETPLEGFSGLDEIAESVAPDAEFESLVAELADTALDIDEDVDSAEDDGDITIDPADTPSVYRELEDLAGSEPAIEIPLVDEATVLFEEISDEDSSDSATESADEHQAETDEDIEPADEATTARAEWGVFEFSDEPSEPDAPVFGVTFGKDDDPGPALELVDEASGESEDAQGQDFTELEAGSPADAPLEPGVGEAEVPEPPLSTPPETDETIDQSDDDFAGDSLAGFEPEVLVADESPEPDKPVVPEPTDAGALIDAFAESEELVMSQPPDAGTAKFDAAPDPGDFAPEETSVETAPEPEPDAAAAIEWGSRWQESAQGWVEDDQGRSTWRPIVTTSPLLSEWQIDTYLGVVSADVVLGSGPVEFEMAAGRTSAMRSMVDEAMLRGAHAIVGVSTTMAPVGRATVLTATGTAVTLKAQD